MMTWGCVVGSMIFNTNSRRPHRNFDPVLNFYYQRMCPARVHNKSFIANHERRFCSFVVYPCPRFVPTTYYYTRLCLISISSGHTINMVLFTTVINNIEYNNILRQSCQVCKMCGQKKCVLI